MDIFVGEVVFFDGWIFYEGDIVLDMRICFLICGGYF